MFTTTKRKLLLSVALLVLAGCFGDDDDDDDGNGGTSSYVAVGNSLTSGFQNSGLRKDWQEASYPALIAEAMGVEDFQLPLIDTPGIGLQRINGQPATPLILEGSSIAPRPLTRPIPRNAPEQRPGPPLQQPGRARSHHPGLPPGL